MGSAALTVMYNLHCPLSAGECPGIYSVSLLSTPLVKEGRPVAGRSVMAQRAGRVVWSAGCQGQCGKQQGWRERVKTPFGRPCWLVNQEVTGDFRAISVKQGMSERHFQKSLL